MSAKNSLTENMSEILANLPAEFHDQLKNEIAAMPDAAPAPLTGEDQVAAIKAELVANPSVDENAAAAELKEIAPAEPVAHLSVDEAAGEIAERIKEIQSNL